MPNGGQFSAQKCCKTCSNRVTALVQCMDGKTRTLEEAGYVKGASAQTELLLAILMSAVKERDGDGQARSCVPECFAPCRPTGGAVTTTVSEASGGFPATHAHPGARGVAKWHCGFAAPGGGICGMVLELVWTDAAPRELAVKLGAGTHWHLAGLCGTRLTECCGPACDSWGHTPLTLPFGAPSSLHMAVLGTRAINYLRSFDAGAEDRPQALAYASIFLAPRLAVLHRNQAFYGTPRQWEEEKARVRERRLIRQGVQPVPQAPDGPASAAGRAAWQLVRSAELCARANPFDAPARSQAELALMKAMPEKPHLLLGAKAARKAGGRSMRSSSGHALSACFDNSRDDGVDSGVGLGGRLFGCGDAAK